jgi:hypothetical protein
MICSSPLRWFFGFAAFACLLALQPGCDRQKMSDSLPNSLGGGENNQQKKIRSSNNLKHLGLSIHNYASSMKSTFPPAYLADKNGKPLLSWRVLILPFMDEQTLYDQFHLDEPWDSPHNKALLPRMPEFFKTPGSKVADQWKTNYLAVRGKDSIISGASPNTIASVRDGLSRTIMVVEVSDAKAVEWTRPDDFEFNPANPIEGIVGLRENCFLILSGDCSVKFPKSSVSTTLLQGWFNKNDGNSVEVQD